MGLFEGVRDKLLQANEALADAHKTWRDDNISQREQAIAEREALIAARLDEIRDTERRWFRRKMGFVAGVVVAALPFLLLGFGIGISSRDKAETSPSKTVGTASPEPAAVEEIKAAPIVKRKSLADLPTDSNGLKTMSEALSFEDCVQRIQAISQEVKAAPTNIVETTELRMVKYYAVDGEILVTCSRPDHKMLVTITPIG